MNDIDPCLFNDWGNGRLISRKEAKSRLEIDTSVLFTGGQGIAGLAVCKKTGTKVFYKIPIKTDYQTRHEARVMSALMCIRDYLPHFCGFYTTVKIPLSDKVHIAEPFDKGGKYLPKDVILMEYLSNSKTFTSQIDKMSKEQMDSAITQTLFAMYIANSVMGFTHNDPHTDNMQVLNVSKDLVMLYRFARNGRVHHFLVPTNGIHTTIIDYGFSHCTSLEGTPLYCSLSHTDSGYLPVACNPISDFKMFLVGLSFDLKEVNPELRRYVREKLFKDYSLNWTRGWDKRAEYSATNFVAELLKEVFGDFVKGLKKVYNDRLDEAVTDGDEVWGDNIKDDIKFMKTYPKKSIFGSYVSTAITMIHSIISHPIKKYRNVDINLVATGFMEEFYKIEKIVHNTQHRLYILYILADIARKYKRRYNTNATPQLLAAMKKEFFDTVDKYFDYFNPQLEFSKLIVSLYGMVRAISTVYYKNIDELLESISKENESLGPLESPFKFVLNYMKTFPVKYKYTRNTEICICDVTKKKMSTVKLRGVSDEDLRCLNSERNIKKGDMLWYSVWGMEQ